jgi:hypothetical protein
MSLSHFFVKGDTTTYTTHLVAMGLNEKTKQAQKNGVWVVSPLWLYSAIYYCTRPSEKLFLADADAVSAPTHEGEAAHLDREKAKEVHANANQEWRKWCMTGHLSTAALSAGILRPEQQPAPEQAPVMSSIQAAGGGEEKVEETKVGSKVEGAAEDAEDDWGDLEAEMEAEMEEDSDGEVAGAGGGGAKRSVDTSEEGGEPPAKKIKRARIRK